MPFLGLHACRNRWTVSAAVSMTSCSLGRQMPRFICIELGHLLCSREIEGGHSFNLFV
jgi:hypothetical protein